MILVRYPLNPISKLRVQSFYLRSKLFFNQSFHECDWGNHNVHIDCHNNTITSLGFQETTIETIGKIPPEIALLSNLKAFSITNLMLTGNLEEIVPEEILQIDLEELNLVSPKRDVMPDRSHHVASHCTASHRIAPETFTNISFLATPISYLFGC